ncbi:MAG TPA: hypothetical protein DHV63_18670 [Pseudomonas sp.]|nr:hypothetical protein [Pseudomonas sp.]
MSLLTALFRRPLRRHYALLDDQHRCCLLLTAMERPHGDRWAEVGEISLGMIGRPLPSVTPPAR